MFFLVISCCEVNCVGVGCSIGVFWVLFCIVLFIVEVLGLVSGGIGGDICKNSL